MRIAIVEDSARDAKTLETMLTDYLDKRGYVAEILCFTCGKELFIESETLAFDLLFLDIYLKHETGIEIAEQLRHDKHPGLVIFTTVSNEHAVEGFRVRAFHYLTKPFTSLELACVLDEALAKLAVEETELRVRDGSAVVNIALSQIRSVAADGHYLHINTTNGSLRWRQSFSRFAELMEPYHQFYVCSRSYMVNMAYADDFTDDGCFLMDDGSKIPVRKLSYASARNRYFNYLFSHMQD